MLKEVGDVGVSFIIKYDFHSQPWMPRERVRSNGERVRCRGPHGDVESSQAFETLEPGTPAERDLDQDIWICGPKLQDLLSTEGNLEVGVSEQEVQRAHQICRIVQGDKSDILSGSPTFSDDND